MQRILVVHPDVALRDELTFVLQHSGFQVISAMGGEQALAEIYRGKTEVVIVAESTPKLNGDEVCVRIRQVCEAPIIVLGQDYEEAAGIGFLEMGADAYLAFPVDWRELVARVRSLLRRHKENAIS